MTDRGSSCTTDVAGESTALQDTMKTKMRNTSRSARVGQFFRSLRFTACCTGGDKYRKRTIERCCCLIVTCCSWLCLPCIFFFHLLVRTVFCGRPYFLAKFHLIGESLRRWLPANITAAVDDMPSTSMSLTSATTNSGTSRDSAPPGLDNLGNTCYFNAVMQIVYQTRLLEHVLCEDRREKAKHTREKEKSDVRENGNPISSSVVDFFKEMRNFEPQSQTPTCFGSLRSSSVSPSQHMLFHRLSSRSTRFQGSRQQDSHELLRHLMEGIKEEQKNEMDESSKLTAVDEVFGGHHLTVFYCQKCKMPYHLFEPFVDVSLPIAFEHEWEQERNRLSRVMITAESRLSEGRAASDRGVAGRRRSDDEYRNKLKAVQQSLSEMTNTPPRESVLNSLLFYTRYEELDEYYCTNCNQGQTDYQLSRGSKKTIIFNPPAILTIHLKRFEQIGGSFVKVSRHIEFEEHLNLAPFCSRFAWRQQPDNGEESFQYRLYGVVVHGGSLEGGHYTACVRVRTVDIKSAKKFLQKTFLDREKMMTKEELIKLVADDIPRLPNRTYYKCGDPAADEWFDISDSHVRRVNLKDVYRKEAYLLFYERIQ